MLDGDDALGGQVLNLRRAVRLPVVDVGVLAHAQRSAGENDGADVVVEARGADGLLVRFGGAGLLAQNEARAHPNRAGTQRHGGREALAIEQAAGGDDLHFGAHAAFLALAHGGDGGDEDGRGDVAGVAAAFTALRADQIGAQREALGHVLGVADHVHVVDAGFVEAVDDGLGRHADGGDEEAGAGVDDDGD